MSKYEEADKLLVASFQSSWKPSAALAPSMHYEIANNQQRTGNYQGALKIYGFLSKMNLA
jgi:hypothetical protein